MIDGTILKQNDDFLIVWNENNDMSKIRRKIMKYKGRFFSFQYALSVSESDKYD